MYKFTAVLISVLLLGFSVTFAQSARSIEVPRTIITGDEVGVPSQIQARTSSTISFDKFFSGSLIWTINNITDTKTGYDLQSNASTQQIWYDLNNPGYVHAVFTHSAVNDNTWADRACLYFGSADNGDLWFELGRIPVSGRGGFPAITGTSTGSAVIANHDNGSGTPTRAKVYIDDDPFAYSFTEYDPGATPSGEAIWPRLGILSNDDIILAASRNATNAGFDINVLSGGVFSGWQNIAGGDQAETYALGTSPGGKVGCVYIGETAGLNNRDILFIESTDGGLTWSAPLTIFNADETQAEFKGALRGTNLTYNGEDPCAVFEIGWVTPTGYFSGRESEIYFWSPAINGGVSKIIADSSDIGGVFPVILQAGGVNDVMFPICRPVIGRAEIEDYLFVAFSATVGDYWPGTGTSDSTAYFTTWFTYSEDGGETWTAPERITPTTPLLDFRFPSIAPVAPVITTPGSEDKIMVHIAMQGDTIPGSTINGWGIMPPLVSAQYYHFTTEITILSNEDKNIVNSFNLEQNYPNPFNPSTKIEYSLGERSDVTLKVYDVLGKEVATLVNATKEAGKHSITFDAGNLASGLYIYTLSTGNFISTKKMMLLK